MVVVLPTTLPMTLANITNSLTNSITYILVNPSKSGNIPSITPSNSSNIPSNSLIVAIVLESITLQGLLGDVAIAS